MTHKAKPRQHVSAGRGWDVDQAGKRVDPNYLSETPTEVENYWSFVDADGFQHTYGLDRPPGRGWWLPICEGPNHHVRSARRRRRS
jgi:hypothetical protein